MGWFRVFLSSIILIAAACSLVTVSVLAQKTTTTTTLPTATLRPIPQDLQVWATKLIDKASPKLQSWISAEAQRKTQSKAPLDVASIGAAANAEFGAKTPLTKTQQELVAALVLYEVTKLDFQRHQALQQQAKVSTQPAIPGRTQEAQGRTLTPQNPAERKVETEDKLGNFELQELMSQYNQAESLASSIKKKSDDTASAVIQKI